MSYESEQENQESQEGAENAEAAPEEGGEDLNAALNGGGEMNFVTETKQPINKGTLIVVGLLIACGALTYFMYVRSGPAEAVAAGDPEAEKTISSFLDGSGKNVDDMRKMLQAPAPLYRSVVAPTLPDGHRRADAEDTRATGFEIALDAPQIRAESGRILTPELPVFLEAVVDDFLKPKGQIRIEDNGRDWSARKNR